MKFPILDFFRLLVCYSIDISEHKSEENGSVAISGGFGPDLKYVDWTIHETMRNKMFPILPMLKK